MISLSVILSEYLIWILIFLPGFLWLKRNHKLATRVFVSAGLSWLASRFIKDFFFSPRPFPRQLLDGSFPSSHASLSFAVAVSIFLSSKRLGILCLILAVLVSLGRVLTRAHYPVDVVGGAILGTIMALSIRHLQFRD